MATATRRVVTTVPSPLGANIRSSPTYGTRTIPPTPENPHDCGNSIIPLNNTGRVLAQQIQILEERSVPPPRSENRPPPDLRCLICFEPKSHTTISTPRCTHDARVCDECLERHVQLSVCDRGFTNVICPILACTEVLSYTDIRAVVKDQSVFERYECLLIRRTLDKLPDFVWCKNPRCSAGQIHANDSSCPTVKCNACGDESCFVHDVPWHEGLTCSQYDVQMRRSAQAGKIRASEVYISKNAKACPNPSCGRMIEKANGCDHMTCMGPLGCGHEFCWYCLADYRPIHEQGNHFHKRRCRHYDSRLKLAMRRVLVWILRL